MIKELNNLISVLNIDKSQISDGYHTFDKLYQFRLAYNALLFNEWYDNPFCTYDVHKSLKHNDGELCFGGEWFIVMAETPYGQISNHYELKYWDYFKIPEKEVANEWKQENVTLDVLFKLINSGKV